MNPDIKICAEITCKKQALSFSQFCGEHCENQKVLERLKSIVKEFSGLYISDIDINDLIIEDIHFDSATITGCDMDNVVFSKCKFDFIDFSNSHFKEVKFINCQFNDSVWKYIRFENGSTLDNTKFSRCEFISCHFNDMPILKNSKFEFVEFTSSTFFGIDDIEKLQFENCDFLSTSISEIKSNSLTVNNCSFENTHLENSSFINSNFSFLENDFGEGELPKLCDFSGSKISNTELPAHFHKWNNCEEELSNFYFRIVSEISTENHANHLWVLNACVFRLNELGIKNDRNFVDEIVSIYKNIWSLFIEEQEYGVLGNIIEQFNDLPQDFKQLAPLLPSANQKRIINQSSITIKVKCNEASISNMALFQTLLLEIEQSLENEKPLLIKSIKQGSIIQTLIGEVDTIVKLAGGFASCISFILITAKGVQHLIKEQMDIQMKKIDLENYRQLKETEFHQKKLEIQKTELELLSKSLEILEKIAKNENVDLEKFLQGDQGKQLKEKVQKLNEHFEIESIEVKIENSDH